ncbi:M50 family metallopeptidase [Flavobacterium aquiphilum]|uniref:M50 family metallopeptidase n=1 Tax=Flavobacterium aquiphilum TaxID=3003261 RepID=UPI00247FFE36|nr:M50 family metallopeptidase [Flavobacterium aquiphilum]
MPLYNTEILDMYSEIQIIPTDEENKYLFIKDNNLIYGGFIVKDIVELLKDHISNKNISIILSEKYNTTIEIETINNLIDLQLNKLLINPKKKRSLRKILKVKLSSEIYYPNFIFELFKIDFFYILLCLTFVANVIFYFTISKKCDLTLKQQMLAYILLFVILIFHEFGHIISAKYHNTKVKEIGIGIYRIVPVLYVNLDEIWKLDKTKRILINLSGIYFQSIIGFILLIIFSVSDLKIFGYLFNINFAVLILNLNPFFQFDGYWVLTDLIKAKNLNQVSNTFLKNIFKKNNTPTFIKIYSILKVILIIYIAYHLFKQILTYVS